MTTSLPKLKKLVGMSSWGSAEEVERRNRILVSLWAYAYEFESVSLVSDAEFDKKCLEIDLTKITHNAKLDAFFRKEFSPYTGQWIHKHPELDKMKQLFNRTRKFYGE